MIVLFTHKHKVAWSQGQSNPTFKNLIPYFWENFPYFYSMLEYSPQLNVTISHRDWATIFNFGR